jgi:hypothetical protein
MRKNICKRNWHTHKTYRPMRHHRLHYGAPLYILYIVQETLRAVQTAKAEGDLPQQRQALLGTLQGRARLTFSGPHRPQSSQPGCLSSPAVPGPKQRSAPGPGGDLPLLPPPLPAGVTHVSIQFHPPNWKASVRSTEFVCIIRELIKAFQGINF